MHVRVAVERQFKIQLFVVWRCSIYVLFLHMHGAGQLKEHLAPVFFPSVFAEDCEVPDIHCEDERPVAT